MAINQTFVDFVTPVPADWLNNVNTIVNKFNIPATFVGSGLPANFGENVSLVASSLTVPEIGGQFTVSSNVGLANTNTAYKIGLTSSALGGPNSASVYGLNTITQGYGGSYLVTGIESDVNNIGADSVSIGGPSAVYGYVGVAAGSFKSTAGLWLTSSGAGAGWQVGVAVSNAISSSYFENSTAGNGLQIAGTHVNGIDMRSSTLTQTLALPNNVQMAQNDNTSTLRNLVYIDNVNHLVLGDPTNVIYSKQSIFPYVDNTYSLGSSSNRWTAVWAVNGTIQTSDKSLKKDISPIPDGMVDLVKSIEPKTFKWINGNNDVIVTDVQNDDEEKTVTSTTALHSREGKRLHWGFLADDVKTGFDSIGKDFGGYIEASDGMKGLRSDQLIPVLWKAIQELSAEIELLKVQINKV